MTNALFSIWLVVVGCNMDCVGVCASSDRGLAFRSLAALVGLACAVVAYTGSHHGVSFVLHPLV